MAKVTNNPKEKMRMNIELADNGIIIRNPENEDEVTLALESGSHKSDGYGMNIDLSDIHRTIGEKIYSWLQHVVIEKHTDFIITNFDIDVVATCKGREFR